MKLPFASTKAGFTLIEIMVVTSLVCILLAINYSLVQNHTLLAKKGYYRGDVHENLRLAANRMSRDIRQALEYTIGVDQRSIQITRSERDGAGNEVIRYITYSHDPVDMEVERSTRLTGPVSSPLPLASHICSLKFEQEGNAVVITITGEKTYVKEGDKGNELYDWQPYGLVLQTKVTPKLYRELQ
ncbi:prepilin-type N-terminal cleavage/methylation domain-containing protein [Desulforamulus aquiferis]|uniref:Prepilin-type N-terminal cleavage/methylation domain-containing protein n=1 Tax=Desulforamulus aquiferis TaxID=1397668 RepID=A0AAW7ZIC2_9FIRM|nr:prepilin-type N-terminal cleavage/methylation domain-containing protein [Desulforamulus aquiferis]MDO7788661.1 prepilin-type N-terminal cleavage/methylation domain-containing protein [Desulforamulus aquiferis]RYD06841.1 hypothetical protein N752_02100 [Desulforamulus aquiferis]